MQKENALPTVVILATGGTIAGVGKGTTRYTPGQIDVESLVKNVPGITEIANIRCIQICNINSDDITAQHWLTLANTINTLAEDAAIHGFVVTHGTDTLDETSYFLQLTVKTEKPVVITGAMRPATAISADGPMNLYQAVALAASKYAIGHGVLVCFSDSIFSGRDVQKSNTHLISAFSEKDYGCLGYMVDGTPCFFRESKQKHTVHTEFQVSKTDRLPKVAVAYFHVEADAGILDYYVENGAKGIVIAGAGSGEYSVCWHKKVKELSAANIPVVRCSRIGTGIIPDNHVFSDFTIDNSDLPPQKAAVLLRLALTITNETDEIRRMIRAY